MLEKMEIWYDSLTGNVRHFVRLVTQSYPVPAHDLKSSQCPPRQLLLITYTFGNGAVPDSTKTFLQQNSSLMRGVVASGSYHWGDNFAKAADQISQQYNVPLIAKINKRGSQADVAAVARWLQHQLKP